MGALFAGIINPSILTAAIFKNKIIGKQIIKIKKEVSLSKKTLKNLGFRDLLIF